MSPKQANTQPQSLLKLNKYSVQLPNISHDTKPQLKQQSVKIQNFEMLQQMQGSRKKKSIKPRPKRVPAEKNDDLAGIMSTIRPSEQGGAMSTLGIKGVELAEEEQASGATPESKIKSL